MPGILCGYGRKNETVIRNYIRNQLEEDYAKGQISLKEYIDPLEKVGQKRQPL